MLVLDSNTAAGLGVELGSMRLGVEFGSIELGVELENIGLGIELESIGFGVEFENIGLDVELGSLKLGVELRSTASVNAMPALLVGLIEFQGRRYALGLVSESRAEQLR